MLSRSLIALLVGAVLALPEVGEARSTVPAETEIAGPQAADLPAPEAGPASRGTETIRYGFYTLVDGEPFAVPNETWTFDHGDPDPLEGWRADDRSVGDAVDAWRRTTTSDWDAHNPVAAPIPSGSGAAWAGYYEDEANAEGWVGGLGYGTNWIQTWNSPEFTYAGSGDVELAFKYFNNTEADFDFTKVLLVLADGATVELASFTGVVGSPPTTYPTYNRTISSAEFQGQTGFRLAFEMSSDAGWDDQDGQYGTPYGPFAVDDISLTNNVVEGDQVWDFETDAGGFTSGQAEGIGTFFETHDVGAYGDVTCADISGLVAAFHDADLVHPNGQQVFAYSPAVDISAAEPTEISAEYSMYSHLRQLEGVFYRTGWQYYPASEGSEEWSDRIGGESWFTTGDAAVCFSPEDTAPLAEIPLDAERVRFVFQLWSDPEAFGLPPCSVEPCNGNKTPLLDNLSILVTSPDETSNVPGPAADVVPFRLQSIAPNPSANTSVLRLSIPEPSLLTAEIFTIDGRSIRHLEGRPVSAGMLDLAWDGKTDSGERTVAGVYLMRLQLRTSDGRGSTLEARIVRVD